MQKITEGIEVYYIVGNHALSGNVTNIEPTKTGFTFAIDSYGACEGNYRIDSSLIGISVFTDRQSAHRLANDPDYRGGFDSSC